MLDHNARYIKGKFFFAMLNKLLIYLRTVLTYAGSNDLHCEHDHTKADFNLKG